MTHEGSRAIAQRRAGYLLLAGSGLVVLLGVATGVQFGRVTEFGLGGLFMATILVAFAGLLRWSASQGRVVATERREGRYHRAGHFAFWIVFGVVLVDSLFGFLPADGAGTVYLAAGLGSLLAYVLGSALLERVTSGA